MKNEILWLGKLVLESGMLSNVQLLRVKRALPATVGVIEFAQKIIDEGYVPDADIHKLESIALEAKRSGKVSAPEYNPFDETENIELSLTKKFNEAYLPFKGIFMALERELMVRAEALKEDQLALDLREKRLVEQEQEIVRKLSNIAEMNAALDEREKFITASEESLFAKVQEHQEKEIELEQRQEDVENLESKLKPAKPGYKLVLNEFEN